MAEPSTDEISTPKAHYVLLFVSGMALLLLSIAFYILLNPNPAQPSATVLAEYYAMVGGGGGLVLAGVADHSIHKWGLRLEFLILEKRKEEAPKEESKS